jgi:hypothetical protein
MNLYGFRTIKQGYTCHGPRYRRAGHRAPQDLAFVFLSLAGTRRRGRIVSIDCSAF